MEHTFRVGLLSRNGPNYNAGLEESKDFTGGRPGAEIKRRGMFFQTNNWANHTGPNGNGFSPGRKPASCMMDQ
jgi:hypothetical protein